MRIGLQVIQFDWSGSIGTKLAEIARAADEAGFYSFWVMDHLFQMEGYSVANFVAGITKNIKIGVLVTGNVYRHPGMLVKTVTALDVLSGGRAYMGIGAGWYEREARGLGLPFPPLKERFERLEETLQIAKQMWRGEVSSYHGKHYQLEETLNSPPPVSQPHPPILIGGEGEKKTLRLVAQYGDACNLFAGWGSFEEGLVSIRHKLEVLRGHCEAVGRNYDEIEKTSLATVHLAPGHLSVDGVLNLCRRLSEVGIQHAIFNMPNTPDITPLEVFGREIIPVVAGFEAVRG
jgi:F420-dependent oxidoreductase-like protein